MKVMLVLLIVVATCHLALTSDSSDVTTLTDKNFADLVESGNKGRVWLVEFYSPWCRHCIKFADSFAEIAKQLKGRVNVGAVNAIANKGLKQRFHIGSYPTFKIFSSSQPEPMQYRGSRTVEVMVQAALAAANHQDNADKRY